MAKIAEFDSLEEAMDALLEQPWSDGLPSVPPTAERVEAMVAAGNRAADEIIGTIAERDISLCVREAAICAVMAGCRPAYFPVVLATWEAMFDPRFNVNSALSSTGGAAIAALVSGPYAEEIGMNAENGVFGPGNRANASIGRAIRLGALSVLKAIVNELDASSFGHGGKYSFHFSERTPPRHWPSIREQLGYPVSATTVTVMAAAAPRQVAHRWSPTPHGFLRTLAAAMKDPSKNSTGCESSYIVALGPEHAALLADAGLSPQDIRESLSEYSKISVAEMAAAGIEYALAPNHFSEPDAEGRMLTARPEHILVVTAGGYGAGWSAVIPYYAYLHAGLAATRAVRPRGMEAPRRGKPMGLLDFA